MLSNCCKNFVNPNTTNPEIKWGELWNEEERHDPPNKDLHKNAPMQPALDSHDPPRSCRLTEKHLPR